MRLIAPKVSPIATDCALLAQEAWAPEPPKMAQRITELRAKLRGTTPDDPSIAAAGDPNGPDLWA